MASTNEDVLLEVRDVSCALSKEETIFHDVSFKVQSGDVLILQGRSGCGYAFKWQHTLAKLITTL